MIYVDTSYLKNNNNNKLVRKNDILMSVANSYNLVGKVSYIDELVEEISFGGFLLCIRYLESVPKYLYYFIRKQFLLGDIQKLASQTTNIANINGEKLSSYPLSLPPLEEQQRIVEKLESMLGKIKQAKELIQESKDTFKTRRASILAKAFSGELTKNWREKNENNIEENISSQEDGLYPIPDSWLISDISSISSFIGSGVTPKGGSSVYLNQGIPFIRSQNVYPEGLYLDGVAYISNEIHDKMSRTKLKPKDVLLNITGASIGRCCFVPDNFAEGNVNQHVCIIRLNDFANYKYVSFYINSPKGQKTIFDEQVGMTREAINYTQIKAITVPLPPLEEQEEIVRIVEKLLKTEDEALEYVESMEEHLEILEKSILSKVFRGELGTNNPDEESSLNLLKEILSEN